jgi:hypothetical protein
MGFFRGAARAYVINRLLGGGRHRGYGSGRHRGGYGYGRQRGYGYGRGRRSSGGVFPIPHYSRRTRGGSRVTVGGCCLPIPLGVFVVGAAALRQLAKA